MKIAVMSTALLAALVMTLGGSGCGGEEAPRLPAAPLGAAVVEYSSTDLDARADSSKASQIVFSDGAVRFEGTGASAKGSVVTVTAAGTYAVSGAAAEGQIVVDLEQDDVVKLVLGGVDLSCTTHAPLSVENADKVVITLSKGTVNRLAGLAPAAPEDIASDEPDAAIFSSSDLTINGEGSLEVTSAHGDGIVSKDDLKIVSGTISVKAAKDAIKGRDCVGVSGGELTLDAGGDGVQSNNDKDAARGYVAIAGGTLDITAGLDGIQAENTLLVLGGTLSLRTGGGSGGAVVPDSPSAKGLKSAVGIYIVGGVVDIDSSDDAVNSNGSVQIDGGSVTASSADDGVHANQAIEVNGGTLAITKSFEGMESPKIIVNDGTVGVVATDDAINAVTVRVEVMLADKPGQKFSSTPDGSEVRINGGHLTLDGGGDGIDSNGGIFMTGGTVIATGPAEGMNVAVDYNSEFIATGGTLVGVGASRLAEAPGASSTQNSMLVKFDSLQDAGSLVHIVSTEGVDLLTFKPIRQYQSLVFSSPDIKVGATYEVYLGGNSTGTAKDGVFSAGTYSGGTKYASLTISGVITTYGPAAGGAPGAGHP